VLKFLDVSSEFEFPNELAILFESEIVRCLVFCMLSPSMVFATSLSVTGFERVDDLESVHKSHFFIFF